MARVKTRDGGDPPAGAGNPEARWFGRDPVDPAEKTARVRAVFDGVARRYDLMNDLMSGGIHRIWKRRFVAEVRPRPGERILDLAGGTGDIAFRLAQAAPGASVLVCDLTEGMVEVGRARAHDRGLDDAVGFVVADAEALPLPSGAFDACTVAFGLRNVTRIDTALAEARRVLRPGGRFLCLEFSRVVVPGLDRLYEAYSEAVIPALGARVARDRASYRYLVDSIRRHPDQASLALRMEQAGFARVGWTNLSGGIAAIHRGRRL